VPDPNREEEISFAEKVDDYLREHSAERLTLAGIARHLHVSPSTLSHRYRQEAGRSPMKRLIEIRIGMAKGLLFRGYPLKTIAEQTGFSDMYHLSKTFKRQEGVSPRAFLRGDAARS
jgi:AraC-like DNA-binding protein